jgi:hypothetical protein
MASNLFTTNKMRLEKKSWAHRNFKAIVAATALSIAGFGVYYYMQPSLPSETMASEANKTKVKPVEGGKALPTFANSVKPSVQGFQGKATPVVKHSKNHESLKLSKSGKHKGHKFASHKKHKGHKFASHKKHKGHKFESHKKHKGHKFASHKKHKGHKFTSHKKHKGPKLVKSGRKQHGEASIRKMHPKRFSQADADDKNLFDL